LLRQAEETEAEMEQLDLRIAEIEEQLCLPEVFQDHERVLPLQTQLEELKEAHEEKMTFWLELQEKIEKVYS
jgi:ATP-binding cassette subfamily F protein 3